MLNDRQDAYGHQLYDCFKGRDVVEVVERDDGFIDTSASLPRYYLAEYKSWWPHEKEAMRYAKGRTLILDAEAEESHSTFRRKASTFLELTYHP